MEKRLLFAFVLSAVIFVVWTTFVAPPPPPHPSGQPTAAAATAAATAAPTSAEGEHTAAEASTETAPVEAEVAPPAPAVEGVAEQTVDLANDVVALRLSNRGAAVTSLVLKGYTDDEGRPLELVQDLQDARRSLPLQLVDGDTPDTRLYAVEETSGGVRFHWADGAGGERDKEIQLPKKGYGIQVTVHVAGSDPVPTLSLGTGMRNIGAGERENRFATWGDAVIDATKVERFKRLKTKEAVVHPGGGVRFAGFEDTYFLSVFRPAGAMGAVRIEPLEESGGAEKEGKPERVLEVLLTPVKGALSGELFAAPKEYNLLQRVDKGVEETLHFGIFHPISVLFLKALRWIHGVVGNWGLAIILLTVAIRIVLFPLMHTSTVSMRRMQKLQPKVKAIQEKYRKHKGDAQMRAKMNQEMMELYKVEGVNPMGGCLPMLVQLPILWALYTLFAYAIELRHAPFGLWIHDLSAKDPYYITPILMTATMWLQQRLAPQAGDPQQQKIFRLMPLVFGIMFLGFPAGLVLYWLTNNVLTIAQQEITLHLVGERQRGGAAGGRKK